MKGRDYIDCGKLKKWLERQVVHSKHRMSIHQSLKQKNIKKLRLFEPLKSLYYIRFYSQTDKAYMKGRLSMKNMFKRSLAAVMAVASLAVGMVGMSANAASSNDYAALDGARDGGYVYLSLYNKTKDARYGQLSCYVYTREGAYVYHDSTHGVIAGKDSMYLHAYSVPENNTYRYVGYGTLYLTQLPQGTPLASLEYTNL